MSDQVICQTLPSTLPAATQISTPWVIPTRCWLSQAGVNWCPIPQFPRIRPHPFKRRHRYSLYLAITPTLLASCAMSLPFSPNSRPRMSRVHLSVHLSTDWRGRQRGRNDRAEKAVSRNRAEIQITWLQCRSKV